MMSNGVDRTRRVFTCGSTRGGEWEMVTWLPSVGGHDIKRELCGLTISLFYNTRLLALRLKSLRCHILLFLCFVLLLVSTGLGFMHLF